MSRGDGWIQTYSVGQFWPLDPRVEEVRIVDICHALSMLCRFTGHVREFYSVAEHSVRVSLEAERRAQEAGMPPDAVSYIAQWGLLHDASEAYLVDLARPVKRMPEMEPYRVAEGRLMVVIADRFNLIPRGYVEPLLVKEVDQILCYTEARDLFPRVHPKWAWHAQPLPERIAPVGPSEAREWFRARFVHLFPGEAWG
jgi:uncharacterized protein